MLEMLQILGLFDILKKEGESLSYYKKILKEHREGEADALTNIAQILMDEEKFDEALKYLEQALRTYQELRDEEGEAFTLNLIGDVYLGVRKFEMALEYYREAFRLYSSARSSAKKDMLEKIKEVEDIWEVIEIAEEERESEIQARPVKEEEYVFDYNKISGKLRKLIKMLETASVYDTYYKEDDPMVHLREALNISREIGDKKVEAGLLLMIGELFLEDAKSSIALNYFRDAYEITHSLKDKKGEAVSLLFIGTVYFIIGDLGKVSTSFRKSVEIFQKLEDKHGESIALELLNTLYEE